MKIKLMAVFFAATTLAALPAQAQSTATTQTASVNARAGLLPVTTVFCEDDGINFGVWRVPVRSSGGVTTITLNGTITGTTVNTSYVIGGNTAGVSLATQYRAPSVAACYLVGSLTRGGSVNTAVTTTPILLSVGSTHEGLPQPQVLADMRASLSTGTSVTTSSAGDAAVLVAGVLTIPDTIVAANFGGYKTGTSAATLTVG